MKRIPKNGQSGSRQAYINTQKFDPNRYKLEKERLSREVLESKTNLCCRRCCEIINWKVDYGKYTPSRQCKKCNICSQKTVHLAYHHICQQCAKSHRLCAKCQKSPECDLPLYFENKLNKLDDDTINPELLDEPFVGSSECENNGDPFFSELTHLSGLDTRALEKQLTDNKKAYESDMLRRLRERERRSVLRHCNADDDD